MKNPGCLNNRGSPLHTSGESSYQTRSFPNPPAAMILKSKAAYGDDVDPPFPLGISSGFYVSKCVPAPRSACSPFLPFVTVWSREPSSSSWSRSWKLDFQSRSYGYRPKRTAQEAVLQV